jgi:hypothetical protein
MAMWFKGHIVLGDAEALKHHKLKLYRRISRLDRSNQKLRITLARLTARMARRPKLN